MKRIIELSRLSSQEMDANIDKQSIYANFIVNHYGTFVAHVIVQDNISKYLPLNYIVYNNSLHLWHVQRSSMRLTIFSPDSSKVSFAIDPEIILSEDPVINIARHYSDGFDASLVEFPQRYICPGINRKYLCDLILVTLI